MKESGQLLRTSHREAPQSEQPSALWTEVRRQQWAPPGVRWVTIPTSGVAVGTRCESASGLSASVRSLAVDAFLPPPLLQPHPPRPPRGKWSHYQIETDASSPWTLKPSLLSNHHSLFLGWVVPDGLGESLASGPWRI